MGDLSRRTMLGRTSAAAVAVGIAATAQAASNPDAVLVEIAQRLIRTQKLIDAWDNDLISMTENESDAAILLIRDDSLKLAKMRPVTPEGLRLKGTVAGMVFEALVCNSPKDTVDSVGNFHEVLAWRFMNDFVAGSA